LSDNQPYSEQYRIVAKEWVDADASASLLEESKSATLARLISDQGDIPVNRAENNVKASKEWQDYITKMVQARRDAAFLKVKLEYIRMKFTEWNSETATRRAEMKL
jgi:cytochrome P450